MSDPDRLPAIGKAVRDIAKLGVGKRTQKVNSILGFKLTQEQLKETWAAELLHRRALFVTALREEKVWP